MRRTHTVSVGFGFVIIPFQPKYHLMLLFVVSACMCRQTRTWKRERRVFFSIYFVLLRFVCDLFVVHPVNNYSVQVLSFCFWQSIGVVSNSIAHCSSIGPSCKRSFDPSILDIWKLFLKPRNLCKRIEFWFTTNFPNKSLRKFLEYSSSFLLHRIAKRFDAQKMMNSVFVRRCKLYVAMWKSHRTHTHTLGWTSIQLFTHHPTQKMVLATPNHIFVRYSCRIQMRTCAGNRKYRNIVRTWNILMCTRSILPREEKKIIPKSIRTMETCAVETNETQTIANHELKRNRHINPSHNVLTYIYMCSRVDLRATFRCRWRNRELGHTENSHSHTFTFGSNRFERK